MVEISNSDLKMRDLNRINVHFYTQFIPFIIC